MLTYTLDNGDTFDFKLVKRAQGEEDEELTLTRETTEPEPGVYKDIYVIDDISNEDVCIMSENISLGRIGIRYNGGEEYIGMWTIQGSDTLYATHMLHEIDENSEDATLYQFCIEEKYNQVNPGGGDNPEDPNNPPQPSMDELIYEVYFDDTTWEVNDQIVTATVNGIEELDNGQKHASISGAELIALEGFDPDYMEVNFVVLEEGLNIDQCFSGRLSVNNDGTTCIANSTSGFIPNDKGILFSVGPRTTNPPELNLPEPNTSANVTITSSDAEHFGSYKDARICINEFPIDIDYLQQEEDIPESISIDNFEYAYDTEHPEEKTVIGFSALFLNKFVGTITVNGESFVIYDPEANPEDNLIDYNNRTDWLNHYSGQTVGFNVEVDRADHYDIVCDLEPMERYNMYIGNFLWTDDPNAEYRRDDQGEIIYDQDGLPEINDEFIGHSRLELLEVIYELDRNCDGDYEDEDEVIHVSGDDLFNDPYIEYDPYGRDGHTRSLVVPEGAECIMRITPRYGYQVTSFGVNGNNIITGEGISEFQFTIMKGNFHLSAKVRPVDDVVDPASEKVRAGSIEIGENEIDSGTVVLLVDDANPTEDKTTHFEETAEEYGEYTVDSYLDISLDQVFYKGTSEDVWANSIHELNGEATIELELEDDMKDKDIIVIHNVDDEDEYEVIEIDSYDEDTNAITFKTDSFSNYAIAVKDNPNSTDDPNDPNNPDNPNDPDNPDDPTNPEEPEEPVVGEEEYTVTLGDFTVIFTDEEGHEFELEVMELLNLKPEQLEEMGISQEEYDTAVAEITEALKEYGTILHVYQIDVFDGQYDHFGGIKIKIKMSEEMKKYNSFKMICIDNDPIGNEDINDLKVVDGYLVGELKHLSNYALVAKNVESTSSNGSTATNNPQTGDNIMFYVVLFVISVVGVGISLKSKK